MATASGGLHPSTPATRDPTLRSAPPHFNYFNYFSLPYSGMAAERTSLLTIYSITLTTYNTLTLGCVPLGMLGLPFIKMSIQHLQLCYILKSSATTNSMGEILSFFKP